MLSFTEVFPFSLKMNVAACRSMAQFSPKVNSGGAELGSSQWKQLAAEMSLNFVLFGKGSKRRVITTKFTILLCVAQIEINIILKSRRNSRNSTTMS